MACLGIGWLWWRSGRVADYAALRRGTLAVSLISTAGHTQWKFVRYRVSRPGTAFERSSFAEHDPRGDEFLLAAVVSPDPLLYPEGPVVYPPSRFAAGTREGWVPGLRALPADGIFRPDYRYHFAVTPYWPLVWTARANPLRGEIRGNTFERDTPEGTAAELWGLLAATRQQFPEMEISCRYNARVRALLDQLQADGRLRWTDTGSRYARIDFIQQPPPIAGRSGN